MITVWHWIAKVDGCTEVSERFSTREQCELNARQSGLRRYNLIERPR